MMSYAQYKNLKKNGKKSELDIRRIAKKAAVEYDSRGRMNYHPDFHPNQGKRFSTEETAYLCKFYDVDPIKTLSLALGRTEKSLEYRIVYLRKKSLIDYYKAKWDRHFK